MNLGEILFGLITTNDFWNFLGKIDEFGDLKEFSQIYKKTPNITDFKNLIYLENWKSGKYGPSEPSCSASPPTRRRGATPARRSHHS